MGGNKVSLGKMLGCRVGGKVMFGKGGSSRLREVCEVDKETSRRLVKGDVLVWEWKYSGW